MARCNETGAWLTHQLLALCVRVAWKAQRCRPAAHMKSKRGAIVLDRAPRGSVVRKAPGLVRVQRRSRCGGWRGARTVRGRAGDQSANDVQQGQQSTNSHSVADAQVGLAVGGRVLGVGALRCQFRTNAGWKGGDADALGVNCKTCQSSGVSISVALLPH